MKKLINICLMFLAAVFVWSCSDSGTGPDPGPPSGGEQASSAKNFVYDAMNYWYYWQKDVPELADNYFETDQAKQDFLLDFSDAEAVFNALLYEEKDDFSFFIDDYEEFQNEQDGVYAALGFNYGFVYKSSDSNELFGYIRYVIPGSPADEAGLKRLQLFTKVDGTTITDQNYLTLLTSDVAHELTLAHIETTENGYTIVEDETVTVESRQVTENPVYITKVIESNGVKIGYLMYNAFQANSHQELNDAFAELQSQGAQELVLDLRYNGGGAVITSQLLGSMISGLGGSDVFAEFDYNSKRDSYDRQVNFLDEVPLQNEDGEFVQDGQGGYVNSEPLNSLNLNRVYVLVSNSTASASEALINGLKPYIDVTMVGLPTVGKDEGSLTLYDAPPPYLDEDQANPDHKKAIQPIVLKLKNSEGVAYPEGLFPNGYSRAAGECVDDASDNCLSEITIENLQEKPGLGTVEEPLFARAITAITGQQPVKAQQTQAIRQIQHLQEVKVPGVITSPRPFRKGMYVEPFMVRQEK